MAKHKLLTKALERTLPPLYSTESVPLREKVIRAKFFNPCGAQTWFVVEGAWQEDAGEWLLWGLVRGHEWEWGYFGLGELLTIRNRFGLGIERDLYFEPGTFAERRVSEGIPEVLLL